MITPPTTKTDVEYLSDLEQRVVKASGELAFFFKAFPKCIPKGDGSAMQNGFSTMSLAKPKKADALKRSTLDVSRRTKVRLL